MGLKLFSAIMFLFALGTFAYFWLNSTRYHTNLRWLRKALYTLFVCAICLGFIFDRLRISDWKELVSIMAMVVFVDLALLLTPNILKMGSAEFEYTNSVEETIKENEKIQKGMVKRIERMSDIIQDAGFFFTGIQYDLTTEQEETHLDSFIEQYSGTFGFVVQLWKVTSNPTDEEETKQQIRTILEQIDDMYVLDLEENLDSHSESLFQTEVVTLLDKDCIIAPVFMSSHSFIVFLRKEKGFLLEVDAVHVLNLVYLYYVYRNMVQ
ncbi:type II toxin-antitoxin system SpoIISA family toxin [Neobacillus ginsengisoli]|uniref:Membrane protein n=1 Tax=Neobacillus ginsengisoli TaxID=904295 RepID=A0ABT9XWT9_9BACI|nr:type II toxin-antitoxin system SpoIISA family toxin [Neobacillus ginsengisoli]MDQ0199974.1 putative membrane protein [Neobacillus ginsengisoli]